MESTEIAKVEPIESVKELLTLTAREQAEERMAPILDELELEWVQLERKEQEEKFDWAKKTVRQMVHFDLDSIDNKDERPLFLLLMRDARLIG